MTWTADNPQPKTAREKVWEYWLVKSKDDRDEYYSSAGWLCDRNQIYSRSAAHMYFGQAIREGRDATLIHVTRYRKACGGALGIVDRALANARDILKANHNKTTRFHWESRYMALASLREAIVKEGAS